MFDHYLIPAHVFLGFSILYLYIAKVVQICLPSKIDHWHEIHIQKHGNSIQGICNVYDGKSFHGMKQQSITDWVQRKKKMEKINYNYICNTYTCKLYVKEQKLFIVNEKKKKKEEKKNKKNSTSKIQATRTAIDQEQKTIWDNITQLKFII